MTQQRKLQTGMAAVALVGLAAAGAAVAATKLRGSKPATIAAAGSYVSAGTSTQGSHEPADGRGHGSRLADAASYLGVTAAALETSLRSGKTLAQVAAATSGKSAAGLIDALVAAEQKEIAADVTAGRLTQAHAASLTAGSKARATAEVNGTEVDGTEVNGTFGGHGRPGGHGPGDGRGEGLAAAATYLGIPQSTLLTSLRAGKTLAQVADATSGKSATGLIAALLAAERTQLAAGVKAGLLTQAEADRVSAGLAARVTAFVNGTRPPGGDAGGDRDGTGGWGSHGGPPAPGGSSGFRTGSHTGSTTTASTTAAAPRI